MQRTILIALCCAIVVAQAVWFHHPGPNWDRLPYYALALEQEGKSLAEAHSGAYLAARSSVPARGYAELAGLEQLPGEYRRAVAESPGAFGQQLAFYKGRYGYIAILATLNRCGIPLPAGATLLSVLPSLAIIVLGALQLGRNEWGVAPWAAALTLSVVLSGIAWVHGPDAMATCLGFLGVTMALRGRPLVGVLALLLTLPFRPDFLLFILMMAPLLARRTRPVWAILLVLGAGAVWACTWQWTRGYSFAVLSRHTFMGSLVRPAETAVTWTVRDQLHSIVGSALPTLGANVPVIVVLVAMGLRWPRIDRFAAVTLTAYLAVKYAVFPNLDPRLYAIVVTLALYLLAESAHGTRTPGAGQRSPLPRYR